MASSVHRKGWLQPSLLMRLTDVDPRQKIEARDSRVISPQNLRKSVIEDLEWLLSTSNLEAFVDLTPYPLVAKSVLNYGIPDISGLSASDAHTKRLRKALVEAITLFEPRLLNRTMNITLDLESVTKKANAIRFTIEAELWSEPTPETILLQTVFDLDKRDVTVEKAAR